MTSVTQRITQYNKEAGQPRGGLVNPKLLTATQLEDEHGVLDHKQENVHASVVGLAVDYLSRLARIRVGAGEEAARAAVDVFRASLMGAQRITDSGGYPSAVEDARQAVLSLNINEHEDSTVGYAIDETAALIACQLATYDVGLRAGVGFYNPESTQRAPDAVTTAHILAMVHRAERFFAEHGPIIADGFLFVSEEQHAAGERGGYTDLVDSGDGDFLTEDTLWDFKVSASKPAKDHVLQLLMYFLMGKQSGLPEFEALTHVGIFNPRLNVVYRLAVADVPPEVIDTTRYDVIGYGA
ncbi:hypothetical protein [Leucobacter sp. USHLN154]|uniref:hypothetical protein n=1 Tax=Leucobacter sp. USHLN154 TaxID=3081269 RepID=UPI0030188706